MQTTQRLVAVIAACVIAGFAGGSDAAQRTFVASYGLSSNVALNCSIANPCRQFSEAMSVTSAGGEIIVLDSAGYGTFTINQSVSIVAPPGVYAGVSVFTGDAIGVNAPSAVVEIKGLTINGLGGANGIYVTAVSKLVAERIDVHGMTATGIVLFALGGKATLIDVASSRNGGYGFLVADMDVELVRARAEYNAFAGISIGAGFATIKDCVAFANGGDGVMVGAYSGFTAATIDGCASSRNGTFGIEVWSNDLGQATRRDVTIARSSISHNDQGGIRGNGYGSLATVAINAYDNAVVNNGGAGIEAGCFGPSAGTLIASRNSFTRNVVGMGTKCGAGWTRSKGDNTTTDNTAFDVVGTWAQLGVQ
jgi:hypothetical protein